MSVCTRESRFRCLGKSFRFVIWLLIYAIALPLPMASASSVAAATGENPATRHVLRRLNSPERAAVIAEAARLDAAGRVSHEQSEMVTPAPSVLREEGAAQRPSPDTRETADASRPQSVPEVLFNYAAGFAGIPGLTPQRGVDGSLDEGLGFHQDGTARKAGGVAGSSGPSVNGQRARSYVQTGLQNGYGMAGYAPGLHGASHDALWGRDDPTRGGRVSGSGAYGSGYSRNFSDFDPMSMAVDRGLNYGAGFVNSMGEAAVSGLVDGGRARLNFRLDKDGYFNGEGDALMPFYDGTHTTAYTQLGARSMHDSDDTRWIGNFGLGQRWFPFAQGDDPKSGNYDAGMLMLGYNAFFDYDFTRDHQRGGFGTEVWYDWLRLSSNYYFPLSNWKGSEDFDSRFVKERAAEGWDARVKAYLPFYRHIALTGAYSQWYGDHVGMFGASKLEKDPKVWSYGIEYTPIPLVSGFITQKSTERGRSDTEFGLNFTYHFQMPWEDQITPAKVAELRTVTGSRHEFVDRENKIILEYKAKNAYHIEYLGQSGSNVFRFRIRNGFDEFVAGQTVRVTASGVTLAAAPAPEQSFLARAGGAIADFFSVSTAHAADFSQTYTTDSRGEFLVTVTSSSSGPITLTVQAGDNTQSFTVNVAGSGSGLRLVFGSVTGNTGTFPSSQTATIPVTVLQNSVAYTTPTTITWSIVSAENSGNRAVVSSYYNRTTGLAWGATATSIPGTDLSTSETSNTDSTGAASIQLTDIMGERTVTVRASVTVGGQTVTSDQTVTFGAGPLSAFRLPTGYTDVPTAQWADAHPISSATSLPAANLCGGYPSDFTSWSSSSDYSVQTNLPSENELKTVSSSTGNGAWLAAGWNADYYWFGRLNLTFSPGSVAVRSGDRYYSPSHESRRVVCRR